MSKMNNGETLNENEEKLLRELFDFAESNRVTFHPIQDVLTKVKKMAANERRCICKPEERLCPCSEAVGELKSEGRCTCWLFSTYNNAHEYLLRHSYIDKLGNVLSDIERKKKEKEKRKL
jgi:ferredoxin-thioredoxin reductase catalytic subunit